ncbi:DUF5691 domain-containing protein [Dictyobacter kobayashii]|uniref:Uncharacterized protein n=1 Tax=Dictyobacter kobayashii TaxID=2014872 RepID=A0A402AN34_9CHLR|nr:DUF5691 domain-containing protein [Dictyobacter kobayashii]GCE20601.1 hypothetical protein KDK_44010 [Dictyobacter kobayashii]
MDTFLRTAVVGTAQQGSQIPATETALDELTQQLPADKGERSFLLAAGAQAIYSQAGMIAASAPEPLATAGPETWAPCSTRVARLIEGLFQQPANILLPEALQHLQRRQLRLPYEMLPQSITYATTHQEIQAAMVPILGERGRWLSQFVPAWSWIEQSEQTQHLPADAEKIWQEGTLKQRQEILGHMRTQDPAKARDWLAAAWKQEKAEVREALLAQLQTGLSLADQSFLEQTLSDRSEGVRQQAADLMLSLSSTPLTQRFLAAAEGFLNYKKNCLTIELPQQLDADRKAALALTPYYSDKLNTEGWLHHALKRVAPQHWSERFALAKEAFIDLVEESPHGYALMTDLQQAAWRYQNVSWYQPLLERCIRYQLRANKSFDSDLCHKMLAQLPQEVAEKLIEPLIRHNDFWPAGIIIAPASWNRSFSLLCLQQLRLYYQDSVEYYKSSGSNLINHTTWQNTFSTVARAIHPDCLELARQPWELPAEDVSWYAQQRQQQMSTFLELIEIRKQLLEEIA